MRDQRNPLRRENTHTKKRSNKREGRKRTFCSRDDNLFIAFHRPWKRRSVIIGKLTCCSEKMKTRKQDEDKNRNDKDERHINSTRAQSTRTVSGNKQSQERHTQRIHFAIRQLTFLSKSGIPG